MPKRKPLCRPWAVLTDGKLSPHGERVPVFRTRKQAREWIGISPYRYKHSTAVRVEVYLAAK